MSSHDNLSETEKSGDIGAVVMPINGHLIQEEQEKRTLFTYKEGEKILRKADWHLIPLLMVAYLLRTMDSGAISYVKTMNPKTEHNILTELHMTTDQFSYTSTVFTIFLVLGEIPSNLLFKWSTPRLHYTRILFLWSIAAICQAAATNRAGLLTARAFLGLFEAGMFPGILVHLTAWYRPDEIGIRLGFISALYQFGNIFNAFLTYGLSFVHKGISGWRYVFIVQGLIGFLLCAIVVVFMPNYPDSAKFLSESERQFVLGRLPANSVRSTDKNFDMKEFKNAIFNKTNVAFAVTLMCFQSGLLGYLFWLPTIIAGLGFKSTASVQLLNIPPAFLYWVGGFAGSWINDHLTSVPRPICFSFPLLVWAGCLAALAFLRHPGSLYAVVCVASIFASWAFNSFFPWRSQSLRGSTDSAVAFAFINGAGQVPGTYTAQIYRSKYAPRYTIPFMVSLGLTLASGVGSFVCWALTYDTEKESRRIAALRRKIGKRDNLVLEEDIIIDERVVARNDNKHNSA